MSEIFPGHVVNDIRARTNLVALVGRRVNLKLRNGAFWGLCPFHTETDASFKVDNERHRYHCFACLADGDVYKWLQETEGLRFPEAVTKLAAEAGIELTRTRIISKPTTLSHLPAPEPSHEPLLARRKLSGEASRLFASCRPITPQSIGGVYLAGRQCALPPDDSDLREHSDIFNWVDRSRWPALVGLITDTVTNTPISLHFTFLAKDGSGKAPVKRDRLYLADHEKADGVVRLWPDAHVTHGLLVGEGIETTLSAARAFQPAWACLDAGNLGTFPVLPSIESITIAEDEDDAGRRHTKACAERWTAAGRDVRILRAA